MSESEIVDKTSKTIIAILVVVVFLGVMLLAVDIIFNGLGQAYVSANGSPVITTDVANESHYMNGTIGYYDLTNNYEYNSSCIVSIITNSTSGKTITSGNYTQDNCRIYIATASFNNTYWNTTYSYSYYANTTILVTGNFIENDLVGMVTNFFALAPTIGTILAVVILIAGIVLLVFYVRRMKDSGASSNEGYTG